MSYTIPYGGGFNGDRTVFAMDGDFTQIMACSAPRLSYPLKGDTFPSLNDIVIYDADLEGFSRFSVGMSPNLQPYSANQAVVVLEQEFCIAQAYYAPIPLNTPYDADSFNPGGWAGTIIDLTTLVLVEEGNIESAGAGIVRFTRKYASLPSTRNEMESFSAQFPSYTDGTSTRQGFTRTVASRVQYDYFIYDDLDILDIPLFDGSEGRRLDASTGLYPEGLIIAQQVYYAPVDTAVEDSIFLGADEPLTDEDGDTPATTPGYTDYLGWIGSAEIVAEASTLNPWMGNIYVRKTRFVIAQ